MVGEGEAGEASELNPRERKRIWMFGDGREGILSKNNSLSRYGETEGHIQGVTSSFWLVHRDKDQIFFFKLDQIIISSECSMKESGLYSLSSGV